MRTVQLLALTFSGLSVLSMTMFREYHHVKTPKTWAEAQRYCREVHADLATVDNQHENYKLLHAVQTHGKFAWIGLHDDLIWWKWTLGDADFNNNDDYSNWDDNQPDNNDSKDSCVVISTHGSWRNKMCDVQRHAVCFNEPGPSKYILVETSMTWNKAKNYCRANYTDLVRVRSMSENKEIRALLSKSAWMGLYRNPWSNWSDQSTTTFKNWNEGQPDNGGKSMPSCAAVNTTTGKWWRVDCKEEHEFICETFIPRSRVTLRFQSEAELTDPDIQQQILEQLHDKLEETHGLTGFKLRWVQTDGKIFQKEQKKKK